MTHPHMPMPGKDWTIAMAYYAALWPQSAPSDTSLDAWRSVYGHLPLDDVIAALRMLAGQFGRRYGPAPGEVLEAAAAVDKARRAQTDAYTAPQLPAGADPHAERNKRRSRVIGKLAMGALDIDGNPTDGFEDDPDLFAYDTDPLLAEMVGVHLTERRLDRREK